MSVNVNEDLMFATEEEMEAVFGVQAEDIVDTEKYLIFVTDNLKFGINANTVVEIITNYSITFLPMLPDFVRGIINLRGDMIPILDVRLRLGKEFKEDCLVIVLNVNGTQLGILVDSVDQMLDIPKEDILPTPVNHTQKLVNGMVSLPDGSGTMMVLDCEELLPHD
ncbi:MAG: purine-binding chemotaxis protein CheW [Oscillospiraceae bacterium]|nr:purine-binding chemotaxis protein CheW [Oscillospiraceae bacterium]